MLVAKVGTGTGDRRVLFSEEQVEQIAEAINRARTTAKVAILTDLDCNTLYRGVSRVLQVSYPP